MIPINKLGGMYERRRIKRRHASELGGAPSA